MPGHKTPDTTAQFSERRTRLPLSAHIPLLCDAAQPIAAKAVC